MIIYMCDVCKKNVDVKLLLRFKIMAKLTRTKLGDKSIDGKDVCYNCYKKIFGGNKNEY